MYMKVHHDQIASWALSFDSVRASKASLPSRTNSRPVASYSKLLSVEQSKHSSLAAPKIPHSLMFLDRGMM